MSKRLSIVIPSINRTELLDAAIGSILAEPGFKDFCEVCIADASQGEETEALVRSKYGTNKNVIYRRTADAQTLDEGVNEAVAMANGKYVWLFGDDDLIVAGFLTELLAYLKKDDPEILIVNSQSFQQAEVIEDLRVPLKNVRVYSPAENDAFLEDLGGYLTYIGGIVIKKELWVKSWRREKVGTYFAHLDAIFHAKIGRTAHYLPQPGIRMRLHYQTWTAKHFTIWNIHYPAVVWGLEGYSTQAKQSVIPRFPLKSLKRILASRAYGRFNLEIWREVLLRSSESTLGVKVASLLIAVLPREFFRLLYIFSIQAGFRKRNSNFSPSLALAQLKK